MTKGKMMLIDNGKFVICSGREILKFARPMVFQIARCKRNLSGGNPTQTRLKIMVPTVVSGSVVVLGSVPT